jgi:Domain of unknown function (DUF4382)
MAVKTSWLVLLLLVACFLNSCSGVSSATQASWITGGSGTGGKAVFALTLRSIPLAPPANTNILSFSVTLSGVSLAQASGNSINIPLNSSTYQVDLTRLQSDSVFLGASTTVPAGTYSNLAVSLTNPVVTYCTQTLGNTGCTPGTVKTVTGGPAVLVLTTNPFPLTVTSGQSTALAIALNLNASLRVDPLSQVVTAVNLGAPNVLGAALLPPALSNLPANAFDFVEDVTGVVTAVDTSAQTVTVQTATGGSITATEGPLTSVSPNCITFNLGSTFTCAQRGQVASLDTTLNSDGTFSLIEYDPLAIATGDWIEGIVGLFPSSSSQFQLVTNNFVLSPSNTLVGKNLALGSVVTVNLVNPKPFVVDTKGLNVPSGSFSGATDTSILLPGQTVAVHVTTFNAASSTAPVAATADFVYLRFTRVTGSVASTAAPNIFAIKSLPPFFGLTNPVNVQLSTTAPSTNFDGIASASGLVTGQPVSIRALYFGSPTGPTPTPTPFSAAKVRVP